MNERYGGIIHLAVITITAAVFRKKELLFAVVRLKGVIRF